MSPLGEGAVSGSSFVTWSQFVTLVPNSSNGYFCTVHETLLMKRASPEPNLILAKLDMSRLLSMFSRAFLSFQTLSAYLNKRGKKSDSSPAVTNSGQK